MNENYPELTAKEASILKPEHRSAIALRRRGMSYAEIGRLCGVGRQTVRKREHKAKRLIDRSNRPRTAMDDLTSQAGSCLCNLCDARTPTEARIFISKLKLGEARGFGKKTADELRRWCGLPPLISRSRELTNRVAKLLFALEAALPFVKAYCGNRTCSSAGGPESLTRLLEEWNWAGIRDQFVGKNL